MVKDAARAGGAAVLVVLLPLFLSGALTTAPCALARPRPPPPRRRRSRPTPASARPVPRADRCAHTRVSSAAADVRQRGLTYPIGEASALRHPVRKRRTEAVRGDVSAAHALQNFSQHGRRDGRARSLADENMRVAIRAWR